MLLKPDCGDILETVNVLIVLCLNMDNNFVCVRLYFCHSVIVSSVTYTKHCVDGQPSGHYFVADTRVVSFSNNAAN